MSKTNEDHLLDRLRYHEKVNMEKVMKAAAKLKENENQKKQSQTMLVWDALPNPFKNQN